MKYKVGDKVRIKSLDWYNKHTNGTEVDCGEYPFTSDMKEFCGQERIIANVCQECYFLLGIDDEFAWTDDMIEGLVEEETKPKMVNLDDVCEWIEKHIFDFPWYDNELGDFSSKDIANALRKAMEK